MIYLKHPEPWQVLIISCLVDHSRGIVVESVAEQLFREFPTVQKMKKAKPEGLFKIVRRCGNGRIRADRIKAICVKWSVKKNREAYLSGELSVDTIPGVKEYGADVFAIFVLKDLTRQPDDEALQKYLKDQSVG